MKNIGQDPIYSYRNFSNIYHGQAVHPPTSMYELAPPPDYYLYQPSCREQQQTVIDQIKIGILIYTIFFKIEEVVDLAWQLLSKTENLKPSRLRVDLLKSEKKYAFLFIYKPR
jgi:hypothetical protein